MSNSVRYVSGEPIKLSDDTSLIDRVIEGPGICSSKAVDTEGNSATGTAFGREAAEDRAIFNLMSKRD